MNRPASARPLAVITGASSGIGFELAKVFIERGFDVVVAAEADIDEAANRLGASVHAGEVFPVEVDLADSGGVTALFDSITELGRSVDVLVLNAGVGVSGPFVENSLEDELNLIALNVTSTVHLAKLVLPQMVERGEGKILVTSSVAATFPGPFYSTYAASKAFGLWFAEGIRYELRDTGVTVTALMPGPTDTEFFERAGMQDTPAWDKDKDDPSDVARDGFVALMRGDDRVVAGSFKNRLEEFMARFLSMDRRASIHGKQVAPSE